MKILLVGLPGAGATTVGGLIGQRLDRPFLDAAALLERTGSPSAALTLLLAMPGEVVAAVPDGVFDVPADRDRLAQAAAHTVWLRCTLPVLARRIGRRYGDDAMAALRRLQAEHGEHYPAVAKQVVDTDAYPAGAVANLVIAQISSGPEDTGR